MADSYRTPYDDKQYNSGNSNRRFATTAIIISGALIGGSAISSYANRQQTNYGQPFRYAGQQYYVPQDSKRAIYPNQQACYRDVPVARQSECEPVNNYTGGSGGPSGIGRWYGPVYNPRDSYQPNAQYPTEAATSSNMGKRLPSGANTHGFGSNGKAFTGSKGG